MPRNTRYRQLARLAARRQAERRRRARRRAAVIAVATAVALVGGALAFAAFVGGKPTSSASGTPTPSATPQPVACGATKPADAGAQKPTFKKAPPMTIDRKGSYTATMKTSCGTVVVRLLADTAPRTVNSFVFLATRKYFDGTIFHRIDTSIDIIQGGDPTGTGQGGPGYTLPDELTGKEAYGPGVMAMANGGANTGGSQFFFVYGPKGHQLDQNPAYTIFGTVVRGLDVLKKIAQIPVQDPTGGIAGQRPSQTVYLESVTVATR